MFKNKTKKGRSNLAAIVALVMVTILASAPSVWVALHGGPDASAATLHISTGLTNAQTGTG